MRWEYGGKEEEEEEEDDDKTTERLRRIDHAFKVSIQNFRSGDRESASTSAENFESRAFGALAIPHTSTLAWC